MFVSISYKIMTIFFDSIIMLRFIWTKVTKRKFMLQKKGKKISIWDGNIENIIISKLVERKN